MDADELQSVGSADDRSRQSSLASLADDLTKRSTYSHRLGLGLDRALENLHPPATTDNQFLSTAAAVATGTASGFGSFRVPIQTEESTKRLSSLAEAAGDEPEDEQAPADAPLQVCAGYIWGVGGLVSQHTHTPIAWAKKKMRPVTDRHTRMRVLFCETHRHQGP